MNSITLEALLEEKQIERVVKAYATALDKHDWAALDEVFAPDATAFYDGFGSVGSRADIVALVRSALERCGTTQHLLGNVVIDIDGDQATAACYLQAIHLGLGGYQGQIMTVWGEYRDRLQRRPEGWRIVHRELAVLHASGDIGLAPPAGD